LQITEGASIQDCEGVFAYLDSRTAAFKAPPFGEKCKLTLLRTCNMLLKRLSKVRVGGWGGWHVWIGAWGAWMDSCAGLLFALPACTAQIAA
jgi:hypothetical protein